MTNILLKCGNSSGAARHPAGNFRISPGESRRAQMKLLPEDYLPILRVPIRHPFCTLAEPKKKWITRKFILRMRHSRNISRGLISGDNWPLSTKMGIIQIVGPLQKKWICTETQNRILVCHVPLRGQVGAWIKNYGQYTDLSEQIRHPSHFCHLAEVARFKISRFKFFT